jgi:purine nucleosidase
MVGWHVSRGASVLTEDEIADVLALGSAKARFAIECNARAKEAYFIQTGERGLSLADPTAMAVALDRSIGPSWSQHLVEIECASELTRGMTIVDRLNVAHDENNRAAWADALEAGNKADICWTFDAPAYKTMLKQALAK